MKKGLILIIGSLPLLWMLGREGVQFTSALFGSTNGVSATTLEGLKNELPERQQEAAKLTLRDEVLIGVLRKEEKRTLTAESQAERELVPVASSYAEKLHLSRQMVEAIELIRTGKEMPPGVRGSLVMVPTFKRLLEEAESFAKVYQAIEGLKKEYPAVTEARRKEIKKTLDDLNRDNGSKTGYDTVPAREAKALVEWVDIGERHQISKVRDRTAVLLDEKMKPEDLQRSVEAYVQALQRYRARHKDTHEVRSRESELRQWEEWSKLVDVVAKERQYASLKERFQAYEDLVKPGEFLDSSEKLHRGLVERLCREHMGKMELPLDELIDVVPDNKPQDTETVKRNRLSLYWKDINKPGVKLVNTPYNEFQYPRDEIDKIYIDDQKGLRATLQGTPKSKAAHAYNECKKGFTEWTGMTIGTLFKACEPHKKHLGPTWDKIEELHREAGECKRLFGPIK